MLKQKIQQEDITILNGLQFEHKASKCKKQTLWKKEMR